MSSVSSVSSSPSLTSSMRLQFFQKALIAFVGACTHIHSRCLSTTCAYGTRRSAQTQGSRTLEDLHLAGPVAPKSQIQGIPSEESGSRLPHNPHNPHNPDDHLVSSVLGTCFALSTYFSLVDGIEVSKHSRAHYGVPPGPPARASPTSAQARRWAASGGRDAGPRQRGERVYRCCGRVEAGPSYANSHKEGCPQSGIQISKIMFQNHRGPACSSPRAGPAWAQQWRSRRGRSLNSGPEGTAARGRARTKRGLCCRSVPSTACTASALAAVSLLLRITLPAPQERSSPLASRGVSEKQNASLSILQY